MPQPAYATFRPRATRIVCAVLAVLTLGGAAAVLVRLSRLDRPHTEDAVTVTVVSILIVLFLHRQWSVRAVPREDGLMVRNVFRSHHLEWAQIVTVRLGDHPWVQLDLSDGTVLAVMAIQRSDGERARSESRRLASLVAAHEGRGMDPGGAGG